MQANTTQDSEPYEKLYQALAPQIGLKIPIRVKIHGEDDEWFFDHRYDRAEIVVHAPVHRPFHEPVFVHYLGHARLLQDGWPRIIATTSVTNPILADVFKDFTTEKKHQVLFYWASRSEDSFFDFYVWQFLCRTLGMSWLQRFLDERIEKNIPEAFSHFAKRPREEFADIFRFLYCLDWFCMYRTLAKASGLEASVELDRLTQALVSKQVFSGSLLPHVETTIPWLRAFYEKLSLEFPRHEELLLHPKIFEERFSTYYKRIWNECGLSHQVTFLRAGP